MDANGHDTRWRVACQGVVLDVRVAPALADLVAFTLAAYPPADPDAPVTAAVTAVPSAEPGHWDVHDGSERCLARSAEAAARKVEWLIISQAIRHASGLLHVHAAALSTQETSFLLVGRSGSGKSTTAVALAHAGLTLYSDDVVLIERATLRPVMVPRPIKLAEESRARLAERGLVIPPAATLEECVARSALPGLPGHAEAGPPITMALFFAPERANQPSLRRLTAAEGMMRLMQQSMTERFVDGGPPPATRELIAMIRCYELTAGTLDDTVDAILALAGAATPVVPRVNGE